MAKIINLNRVRKLRGREDKAALAAINRVKFGRTKEQKARDQASEIESQRKLDQLRRESDAESPDSD